MTSSHASKGRNELERIDNALLNATAGLFDYYYMMLRADLGIAASIEMMLRDIDETRRHLRDVHIAAWEVDNRCFDTVGTIGKLIKEARSDVLGRHGKCQAYSNVLDRSAKASYKLLRQRAEAFSKQST